MNSNRTAETNKLKAPTYVICNMEYVCKLINCTNFYHELMITGKCEITKIFDLEKVVTFSYNF